MRHRMSSWIVQQSLAAVTAAGFVAHAAAADERPLSADRPDRTESPYTVPRGCFQLETDLVSAGRYGSATVDDFGTINLKAGLSRTFDLQLVSAVHQGRTLTTETAPEVRESSWLPSLGLRLKWNLAGNDSGPFAMALLSYAEFPFLEDDTPTVTGFVLPVGAALPNDFGFGAMAGIERAEGEGSVMIASATIGRPIAGPLAAFVEAFGAWEWDAGPGAVSETTLDWGITYDLTPTLRFDIGAYHGLSRDAEDVRIFAGGTWRVPR